MPKYYVESGYLQLVIDAFDSEDAAVKAIQWSFDKADRVQAAESLRSLEETEVQDGDLDVAIQVSERGFGRPDAMIFDTLDVVAAWQSHAFPWL